MSYNNAKDYNKGQDIGILIGGSEIGGGGTIAAGGVALSVGSGGTLAIVGAPAAVGGVAVASHGVAVVKTAATNLANQKGRVSETENGVKEKLQYHLKEKVLSLQVSVILRERTQKHKELKC